MTSSDDLQMAAVFKALSNPVRLGMLRYLAAHPDCFCGDVVLFAGLAQSTVSSHLAVLRQAGLVCGTADGPATCLCVNVESLQHLSRQVGELVGQLAESACCGDGDGGAGDAACCTVNLDVRGGARDVVNDVRAPQAVETHSEAVLLS